MKGLLILMFAVVVSIAGSLWYFRMETAPTTAMLNHPDGELEWLRREFQLDDGQFARIRAKHDEYASKCDQMCAQIAQANGRLDEMIEANVGVTPEVETALREVADVQGKCRLAMLGHVYAVGEEMSPAQRARYLKMMKGRIRQPGQTHQEVFSRNRK